MLNAASSYFRLLKSNPRTLSYSLLSCFFSFCGQSHFLSLFSAYFIVQLSLTKKDYGALYAAATLLSAFTLPLVGPFIDKIDVRKFSFFVFLGLMAGFLIILNSQNIYFVGAGLFLLRLNGQALCGHIGNVSGARYFSKERGKAMSIISSGYPLAEGIVTPIMAIILVRSHPTSAIYTAIGLLLFIFLPKLLLLTNGIHEFNKPKSLNTKVKPTEESSQQTNLESISEPPNLAIDDTQKHWKLKDVLKDIKFFMILPYMLFPAFSLTGFLLYQSYFCELKSWTPESIALGISTFALGRFVFSYITGPFIDRFSAKKLFPYIQIPLFVGYVLFATVDSSLIIYLIMLLFGFSVGAAGPIKSSLWPELYGTKHLGAIKSIYASIAVFSTALSSLLFGKMADINLGLNIFYILLTLHLCSFLLVFTAIKWVFPESKLNT